MMNAVPSLRRRRSVRGFTLVELLTVIAIIGILATILIPAIGGVRKRAGMTKSSSNLRQIGLGYQSFSDSGSRRVNITNTDGAWTAGNRKATDVAQWAQVLADRGGLNDASLYIVDIDPLLSGVTNVPRQILSVSDTGTATANEDWQKLADAGAIAYDVVVNAATNAAPSTTPLAWTRGLQADGTWDDSKNPWGAKEGGHLLFVDGHVEFHDNLTGDSTGGVLIDKDGKATKDIAAAINPTNVTGDNAPAILRPTPKES